MRYIKNFENVNSKPEVGDYVKFKSISNYYNTIVGELIFEVLDEFSAHFDDDDRFLKITSVFEKYQFSDIPAHTVRQLTDDERTELDLQLSIIYDNDF